jgi:hypothetical protein
VGFLDETLEHRASGPIRQATRPHYLKTVMEVDLEKIIAKARKAVAKFPRNPAK